jgi:hypothetical protein
LERDPAPHPYRRIVRTHDGGLMIAEKSWRLCFEVSDHDVTITRLKSGYRNEVIATSDAATLLDGAAHVAFHARWP